MSEGTREHSAKILASLSGLLPDLEVVYKDLHSHPELSTRETRTAGIAAERLRAAGYGSASQPFADGFTRLRGGAGRRLSRRSSKSEGGLVQNPIAVPREPRRTKV